MQPTHSHRLMRCSAQDAVVLKALSWVLTQDWAPHIDRRCHHVKSHGGLKGALKGLAQAIQAGERQQTRSEYHFVVKSSLDTMIPQGCAYARFMDDGGTLTRTLTLTRCQVLKMKVRQVVQNMHAIVHGLKMKLALKKTLIGRISKGFDFWGYRFGALGLAGLAQQTIDNYQQRLLRLYEPGASDQRVEKYERNWLRWTVSGLVGYASVLD
jgi:hypothetical protein